VPSFKSYDGTEITCTVLGRSTTAVVCLPGGPLRPPAYLGNLGGLEDYRELVLVSLPRRRLDSIVDDLEVLRAHLGQERLDLLGHSAGASLAMLYAATHPDHVSRLALVTPSLRAVWIPPTEEEMAAAETARRDEDDGYEPAAGDVALYYAEGALDAAAVREALRRLEAKALVLLGGLDTQTTPRMGRELAALWPQATYVVLEGAGHFPWRDDPARCSAVLGEFFGPPQPA
jgi:pimeloyl-ACP methyl ester carboxylesterase